MWLSQRSIGFSRINYQILDHVPDSATLQCIKQCPNPTSIHFGNNRQITNIGGLLSELCSNIKHVKSHIIDRIIEMIDCKH